MERYSEYKRPGKIRTSTRSDRNRLRDVRSGTAFDTASSVFPLLQRDRSVLVHGRVFSVIARNTILRLRKHFVVESSRTRRSLLRIRHLNVAESSRTRRSILRIPYLPPGTESILDTGLWVHYPERELPPVYLTALHRRREALTKSA